MAKSSKTDTTATVDRRRDKSRRGAEERRTKPAPVATERRQLERRAKVSRRRQIDPTTCERDYSPVEVEFMNALDDYKRRSGRMFPTCSEILEVILSLGYEKRRPTDGAEPAAIAAPGFVGATLHNDEDAEDADEESDVDSDEDADELD